MEADALLLSRVQFAFVISFHILFPAFTIGLASFLAMLEFLWLRTGRETYRTLYKFWLKLFAISFAMGVVSGIVMSYQFGTNWSRFSDAAGAVIGPLLGYEVLTAFFLEATFLGIMLFGWKRVGNRFHFLSTLMVALGTLLSSFWVISANSWMQTPAGYTINNGLFEPSDWWAVIFNPSFPYRLVHMVLAAYLTTCFAVAGISAWHLRRGKAIADSRTALRMAVCFAAIVAPLQIVAGDFHGLQVRDTQPAKLAALEGHWETRAGQPFILFAVPDREREQNRLEVAIPKAGSLILTHDPNGIVRGLKDFPEDQRPPILIPFFAFRLMVALGVLMALTGLLGAWLLWRKKLDAAAWFHRLCVVLTPSGFIAILMGWFVAEVGRQPWVVYGVMRTAAARSPVPLGSVAFSFSLFVIAYTVIFGAGLYYIGRIITAGPGASEPATAGAKSPARPLSLPDDRPEPAE